VEAPVLGVPGALPAWGRWGTPLASPPAAAAPSWAVCPLASPWRASAEAVPCGVPCGVPWIFPFAASCGARRGRGELLQNGQPGLLVGEGHQDLARHNGGTQTPG